MKRTRDKIPPFDVAKLEAQMRAKQAAIADRKWRRREKRTRLNIAVSPLGSESETTADPDEEDGSSTSSDQREEDKTIIGDRMTGRGKTKVNYRINNLVVDADSDSHEKKALRQRHHHRKGRLAEDSTGSSDDSLLEDIKSKTEGHIAKKAKLSAKSIKPSPPRKKDIPLGEQWKMPASSMNKSYMKKPPSVDLVSHHTSNI
jgi:hypothetical protein